jgi:hypothetical protein
MMRRTGSFLLAASLIVAASVATRAAEEVKPAAPAAPAKPAAPTAPAAPAAKAQLATEGQYGMWLVQVLGLSRFVSAAPTPQECFAVLLQNQIAPKAGWNATSVVSRATLARTVVQALGQQSQIKDPNNDGEWIDYLKKIGFEFATLGEALKQLDPLDAALGNVAVAVSTDPLGKIHRIRPTDDQQMGADLSTIRRVLTFIEEQPTPPAPTPRPRPSRGPDDDGPDPTPSAA